MPRARDTVRTSAAALAAVALLGSPSALRAQTTAASAATSATDAPLSPLPELPRVELPAPTKDSLETLDRLLATVTSADAAERERARRTILEVNRELIPAIARRIDTIAESADRRGMDRLLDHIRDDARDALRAVMKARGEKGRLETPDYLEMLLDQARPSEEAWDPLVRVVAMSRMLAQIGTIEAVRELIRVRVRYEFLRRDVQLLLEALGERAIAGLIEAQKHPAKAVARWAEARLDLRGKAIPSETVQTDDLGVLADVLRAYGRIRDPDAARLVISFANSERAQVRLAARQAVRMLGEVANWQLRDTYENVVGRRPPREWSWERTARELFTEFDRLRLARVQRLFEDGKKAFGDGKLEAAVEAFDAVLVRSPRFEHATVMIPAYVAFARAHLDDQPADARRALGRARRLASDDLQHKSVDSLRMTLEAEALLGDKIADQVLLRRALELDPDNARAQSLLDRVQRGDVEKRTTFNRHVAAGTVGGVALLSILLILLRRPRTPGDDPAREAESSSDPATPDGSKAGEGAPAVDPGAAPTKPGPDAHPADGGPRASERVPDTPSADRRAGTTEGAPVEPSTARVANSGASAAAVLSAERSASETEGNAAPDASDVDDVSSSS